MSPLPKTQSSLAARAEIDDEDVEKEIEEVVRSGVRAVNLRDFDMTSPAWSSFSRAFYNDPDGPSFQRFVAQSGVPSATRKPKSLEEFLNVHRAVSLKNPSYSMSIVNLDTTVVNVKAGYAQVIMTGETTGIPVGVIRRSISAFDFRLVDGKWLAVNTKTLPGMDPSTGPAMF